MNTEKRFITLWTDYLEGELNEAELEELRRLMAEDAHLVEMAADSLRTHRLLGMAQDKTWQQDEFVSEIMARLPIDDEEFIDDIMHRLPCCPVPAPRRRRLKSWWALAAAAVIALAAVTVVLLNPTRSTIAHITALSGSVQWTGDGGQIRQDLEVGTAIDGGVLETLSHDSWIECTFLDGTKITISGQTMVTLSESDRQKVIHLREGSLSADVTPQPQGKPMRMITRTAEAHVLGTQFNVVSEQQSTRLTVNKGLVQVRRLADGCTQKVPADHVIVADLAQKTEFRPVPRKEYVSAWKASLTKDILYGKWKPGNGDKPDRIRAQPMLYRGDDGKLPNPILLHIVTIGTNTATPLLEAGAHIRIRGKVTKTQHVMFGFAAHYKKGGFAGKYFAGRNIIAGTREKDMFEVDIPLEQFGRHNNTESYPQSPVGLELHEFWILTVQKDAGLEVMEFELHK